eukprot:CAMPEP_0179484142 /NCGR_PEP_ID=MMETSP0799-20121207/61113_1 /TAXON_ID=46947 /ORGANISM="Geminigera cryophila, Strain CCMP2564" /LENGTH=48 /DNA_ID= /DNA_START= /DNA_END= /DNA_ORIENTATION=
MAAIVEETGMGGLPFPPSRSQHSLRNLPSPQCGVADRQICGSSVGSHG